MRHGTSCPLLVLSLLTGEAAAHLPSADIAGARFVSASDQVADSNASFGIGLTRDGGQAFVTGVRRADSVRIIEVTKVRGERLRSCSREFPMGCSPHALQWFPPWRN